MQHALTASVNRLGWGIYERVLLVMSSIGTVLILGWVLRYCSYGIDFTDESYYLVSIANPFLYDWSVTQFGFFYNPLYSILDGDITSLRQANVVITFALSWILMDMVLRMLVYPVAGHKLVRLSVAAGFAVASLIAFDTWLVTPSYNSLALQAVLVSSMGMLMASRLPSWKSVSGWGLLGVGGWMAFMAKPSTALASSCLVLLYLIVRRQFVIRMAWIAIGCGLMLLLASAVLIDGSVYKFLDRLKTGVAFASYLGGGHTLGNIIRLDEFRLSGRERNSMLVIAALVFFSTWRASSRALLGSAFSVMTHIFFGGVVVALSCGFIHKPAGFREFQDMMIWSITWPALLIGLLTIREKKISFMTGSNLGLVFSFLVMPYVYALGTGRNYWLASGSAALFWLLGGVVLLGVVARMKGDWAFALPLVVATQAVSATLLQTGMEQPYRQPQPLRQNDRAVEFGAAGSVLRLSEGYANYVEVARSAAREAGFQPGTPIIDLTGHSPGLLYALNARSIGQAWVIGGYPGSSKLAAAALYRVRCELVSSAWLLVEPGGPRQIDEGVLAAFGGNLATDFAKVASWRTTNGFAGELDVRTQILYKPIRQAELTNACRVIQSRGAF